MINLQLFFVQIARMIQFEVNNCQHLFLRAENIFIFFFWVRISLDFGWS